jgi:hypothetical protein
MSSFDKSQTKKRTKRKTGATTKKGTVMTRKPTTDTRSEREKCLDFTQFGVAWIACEGSSEKQIGAECLEPGEQVWGVPFPQQVDEYEEKE